jgi:Response receiver domain
MNSYGDAIIEAYIEPLKTALIIDDDYPTLDEILAPEIDEEPNKLHLSKAWRTDGKEKGKMRDLLYSLREHMPPLIVDMHDGSDGDNDEELVKRFHQSDFLVLDWNLEPGSDSGAKALKILEQLLGNDHFNIVVINSKKTSSEIFDTIIQSFAEIHSEIWNDYDSDIESILEKINEDADTIQSLQEDRSMYIVGLSIPADKLPLDAAAHIIDLASSSFSGALEIADKHSLTAAEKQKLVAHLLAEQKQHFKVDEGYIRSKLEWTASTSSSLWIKAKSVFIAFSEKEHNEKPLEVAISALVESSPRPDQLILAKLRNVIDDSGLALQGRALQMKHASALWYRTLLKSSDDLPYQTEQVVHRHSSSLIHEVMPEIVQYTQRLIAFENANEPKSNRVCKERYGVTLSEEIDLALDQHNRIVSTMPITGSHLTTGHIFKASNDLWVCLSPKCSLEPSQSNNRQASYIEDGNPIQFSALLLKKLGKSGHADLPSNTRSRATTKDLLYLDIGDGLTIYEAKPKNSTQKYKTETFFVKQSTWLQEDSANPKVTIVLQNPRDGDTEPNEENCEVVDQLREEYALSLLRRVSLQASEIGLEYL